MRALRALREVRPWSRGTVCRVIAVLGGALWWWAALRLAVRPDVAGPWEGAMAAGGWSLGLIPLHAVPRRDGSGPDPGAGADRRLGDASVRRPGVRLAAVRPDPTAEPAPGARPLPGQRVRPACVPGPAGQLAAGAGPRWQRGHQ